MSDFPTYDEVHVISDIHMGGAEGFQILRETARLAEFVRWVAQQSPGGKVALVLNGDVFDTLAEDIQGYVATTRAVQTVSRIMDDPSFKGVWEALAAFTEVDGRNLVFVIGNHDIEIAFPTVQRLILTRLAGDDLQRRARIEFSTTGAGYTCFVGGAKIYCTHGNEVDAWNFNRYEDLAKVSRRLNAGKELQPDEWYPNAGTRMVKEVMNEVKKTYKWIDLLKPETTAAVGTLVVIDPAQAKKIADVLSIVGEKVVDTRQVNQRLSADGFKTPQQDTHAAVSVDQLLGKNLTATLNAAPQGGSQSVDDMLLAAETNLGNPEARIAKADGSLGTGRLIWDRLTGRITGVGKDEALRKALQDWLKDDRTFDTADEDETFKAVTAAVGSSIDFIITGHTHLERAIKMGGNRFYFNCGTWIRLLRFSDAMLKTQESFAKVYDLLVNNQGKMELIDTAKFPDEAGKAQPFVLNQTSSVSIRVKDGTVVGELNHVTGFGEGDGKKIAVKPEVTFTRK